MAINFPNSPATNEVFTTGATGPAWVYDGAVWNLVSTANDGIEAAIAAEVTARNAADAVVTDAFTAADVVVTDAFTAADVVVTDAFTAADALLLTNPLTTKGDIVIQDTSAATRLAKGTEGQYLVMGGSDLPVWGDGLVINEAGAAVDFRVESDTNTHAFFIDGSADSISAQVSGGVTIKEGDAFDYAALTLENSGTAPSAAHKAELHFDVNGTGGNATRAKIRGGKTDTGSTNGSLLFDLLDSGVIEERLSLLPSEAVFNDPGNDVDFRVESDTNTHSLFVQGSDGYVGINEDSPAGRLHITHPDWPHIGSTAYHVNGKDLIIEGTTNMGMSIIAGTNTSSQIHFGDYNWTSAGVITYDNATDQFHVVTQGAFQVFIKNGMKLGAPTGGYKGIGTLNATGVYVNGEALSASPQVINEAGIDVDFRVESDTETHALFVRGSDGRVALGGGVYGTQNTHEIVIDDTTAFATSITGGSGFYPQSSDTLAIGNDDQTTVDGYTSLHMVRGGSNGAAAAKIALSNRSGGNGRLSFMLRDNAHTTTIDEKMHIDNFGVMINPLGTDRDLQVQSDTETHALFVQGSDGFVGIGESAPLGNLHVTSGSSGLGTVNASGDDLILESAGNTGMTLMSPNTGYQYVMFADADSNVAASIRYAHPTDKFSFYVQGTSYLDVSATTTVINDAGADHDFRVESDTNAHALFVQGSDGKVGIGEIAPLGNLHVTSGSSGLGTVNASGDDLILESAGNTGMTLMSPNTSNQYIMFADADSNEAASIRYSHSADRFIFYVGGADKLSVSGTTTIINDAGENTSFRVQSGSKTHALFVEGNSGHIGIGNSTPLSPLDISIATGDSGSSSGLRISSVDGGGWSLYPTSAVANPVWNTNVNSGESHAWSVGGSNVMSLANGLQLGAPTGGDKGTGTLNAVSVYDDNTLLTDYVLDQAVDGTIDHTFYDNLELGGDAAREWDVANLDIDHYEEQWRSRRSLPAFRSKADRFDEDGTEIRDSIGTLVQGLQQELETAMVHIAQLNARLKKLENV